MTDYNSHVQSIEAGNVFTQATLVATGDDHTAEDEKALYVAIDAFRAIGGTAEQVVGILGRAGVQAYVNCGAAWQSHKGDQVLWKNDPYVVLEVLGTGATIQDPLVFQIIDS